MKIENNSSLRGSAALFGGDEAIQRRDCFASLAMTALLILFASTSIAAPGPKPEEGILSAKGKLTQVNPAEKVLLIKIEKGLELTFFVDEATQIQAGKETRLLTDLQAGDSVEIEYLYDQDFKKILRSVRKE